MRLHHHPTMYTDIRYMQRALTLAEKGMGFVSPNPLVGAVIVRDETILGEGYHAVFGGDHAEVAAVKAAEAKGYDVAGATMYVTLEPCTHHGKTPPCTDLILAKKLRRVVIAMPDPHPFAGGGADRLHHHGIHVTMGLLRRQAEEINRFFLHGFRTRRPFFTAKAAVSTNGMIAEAPGKRTQLSGPEAQAFAHALRQAHDAILVGTDTVLTDDPLLSVRHGYARRDPLRVLIDPKRRIPPQARVFRDDNYLLFTRRQPQDPLTHKNHVFLEGELNLIPPATIAHELWERDIRSVLIEGGARTIETFLEARLIDELIIIETPTRLPKSGVPLFPRRFPKGFAERHEQQLELGDDVAKVYEQAS